MTEEVKGLGSSSEQRSSEPSHKPNDALHEKRPAFPLDSELISLGNNLHDEVDFERLPLIDFRWLANVNLVYLHNQLQKFDNNFNGDATVDKHGGDLDELGDTLHRYSESCLELILVVLKP